MRTYFEEIAIVKRFMRDNNLNPYMLQKYAKDLCCCRTCAYYVQHYSKEGEALDFGHCDKGNIQHSKKPSTASCGHWKDVEE